MRADRAAAGLSGVAVLVVIALSPGGVAVMEIVLLVTAGLVFLGTFAPALPLLHRLPGVGAPRVSVALSFEPMGGGSEDLVVSHYGGMIPLPCVLRVGFNNQGPRRVQGTLINVLVDLGVDIEGSDYLGDTSITHGRPMPRTEVDRRPMCFWADKDVTLTVGGTLLNYRLRFPDVGILGDEFVIRVQYDSDDLHGGERVHERRVPVVDMEQQ
jgi:hypothetical protein